MSLLRKRCHGCQRVVEVPFDVVPLNCDACRRDNTQASPNAGGLTAFVTPSDVDTGDIKILLRRAAQPIVDRPQTFIEWIGGVNVIDKQVQEKLTATRQVGDIAEARTQVVQKVHAMMLAAAQLADIQTEAQRKQVAARVEHLRLVAEQLRLEEEIEHRESTKADRLTTLQLEEGKKQKALRAALDPPEVPDRDAAALDAERRRRRIAALGGQSLVRDFLAQIKLAMTSDCDKAERAMRLRVVLDAYGMEADDLPRDAREFLAQMEEAGDV